MSDPISEEMTARRSLCGNVAERVMQMTDKLEAQKEIWKACNITFDMYMDRISKKADFPDCMRKSAPHE